MPRSSHAAAATKLVLASTSAYRRSLLERFGLPFTVEGPHIDESRRPNEDAMELVHRLAKAKAEVIATRYPDSVVIGSDQVAVRGALILGKPGSAETCIEQLKQSSGQRVYFHTGVHVIGSQGQQHHAHVDTTTVTFRNLASEEIERYVSRERPLDCAGGFKVEGLGISLFERVDSQDPTALIGLPLIWLAETLRRVGLTIP
jgi:septum formation protein